MHLPISRSVLLDGNDPELKRRELRDYFQRTWNLYEHLFELLACDDAFYQRPEPLRHPLIFYFGHTATFYVNKLTLAKAMDRINPAFESMFAIGVDEMSWDDLNEAHYEWPAMAAVRAYRAEVRRQVEKAIDELHLALPISWDDHPAWAVLMGIEHERIHLETSSVLIRQLDLRWLRAQPAWAACPDHGEAPHNELLPIAGGRVALGKKHGHRLYGWDNEYGRHEAEVMDFEASKYLVSNAEFFEFMLAGAYATPEWWTEEGRGWLAYRKPTHPVFWVPDGRGYRFRTLAAEMEMPWDWPVEVNYLEAKAFCNWKAAKEGRPIRLPSEDEWYRLVDFLGLADEPDWGPRAHWNINLEHYASSVPVDRFGCGGFFDVVGNVWQWTETPIYGFEGFAVHPLYDDFSTPTFDNRHNLFKGGSWISTGNEATLASRYAFRRHFFQHAGFRYVAGAALEDTEEAPNAGYETDAAVAQYCEFHYGGEYFGVANFPVALARLAVAAHGEGPRGRALDLGCAVGRASFELAGAFEHVTGIDFSARFIRQAIALQEKGEIAWAVVEEGDISSMEKVSMAGLGYAGREERVAFWQGDACNLKPIFAGYDLILAGNLIDRLYNPRKFLEEVHLRLNDGGTLVLASPYTWLAEYTEKERWLGGFIGEDGPVRTLQTLEAILSRHFEPVGEPVDLPFVIRETGRKFQHTLSQVSAWKKKANSTS